MATFDAITVIHDWAQRLPRAFVSLPDWVDTVVVDNASSGCNDELARSAAVTAVANDVSAGFSVAFNHGSSLGDADLIPSLNPDATIDGENLGKLLRRMEDDPGIGLASPIRQPDWSNQRMRRPFPTAGNAWRVALGLLRLGLRSGDDQAFVIVECFRVRRWFFTEARGFVPHFMPPFTDSPAPTKAYECLALGRLKIATPVGAFRALPSPVVPAEMECFVTEAPMRWHATSPS